MKSERSVSVSADRPTGPQRKPKKEKVRIRPLPPDTNTAPPRNRRGRTQMHSSGFGRSGRRLTVYLTEPFQRRHHSDRLAGILTLFHSAGNPGVQAARYELVKIVPHFFLLVNRKPLDCPTGSVLTWEKDQPIIIQVPLLCLPKPGRHDLTKEHIIWICFYIWLS